ncbi:integral membrane transport protein [Rhodococcus wratislaviensis]|uniref:Integral membrane transport protein n=1 Tax=Rhodococcus wratislaviensis TaxID=44752 RepID=A0A402C2T4_RHOWR|nr:MFS transporter [Rhodococcus wratislaviensis]GCE37872.1 integral membrane transport protein [Rhodococcus wratislaviensis]
MTVDHTVQTAAPSRPWADLTRRYGLLYVLLFLFGAEMYLVAPLLPTISDDFGVPTTHIAALVTVYVIVQAVAGPFQGLAYPILGARTLVVAGSLTFAAGNILAAVTDHFAVLTVSRAIAGLGVSLAGPAIWAWIAHTAHEEVRGTAVGAAMGSFAVGQVCGVPIGSFIASAAGWHWSFAVMGISAVLAAPLLHLALKQARPTPAEDRDTAPQWKTLLRAWHPGLLRGTLLVTFGFHAANLGAYTFLSEILADKHHLDVAQLGYIGALSGTGMFVGAVAGGRIADHLRRRGRTEYTVLPLWLLIVGTAIAVAVLSNQLWLSLALVPVWFFAAGAFDTNQQTAVARLSPGFTAVALAWNLSVLYAAAAFGVWAMSAGTNRAGSVSGVAGVLLLLAFVGANLLGVRQRKTPPSPNGPEESTNPQSCDRTAESEVR